MRSEGEMGVSVRMREDRVNGMITGKNQLRELMTRCEGAREQVSQDEQIKGGSNSMGDTGVRITSSPALSSKPRRNSKGAM